ncbi:MAG: hypothetical protein GKS05_03510 [Nitrospirales bacterium]|nr:hypothetical protein [Nitrospirales bacterium]
MQEKTLSKVTAQTAGEICQYFELGDKARSLLNDDVTPRIFLDFLIECQQFTDAVRFLAHALPKREAVWWACLCAKVRCDDKKPAPVTATLHVAEQWVCDPNETNRRAALSIAESTGLNVPASWAAMGAFWSGGSIAPPDATVVPPGEYLTAIAVAGAVMLAAVLHEPEKVSEQFMTFLTDGIGVANGTNEWPGFEQFEATLSMV